MQARQAVFETRSVVGDVKVGLLPELFTRLEDEVVAALFPHGLGRVVGVAASAVPVTLHRLGLERDHHAVLLGDAMEQVARHVQVVAHFEEPGRTDLELPLPGHDLGVDAGEREPGVQAGFDVLVRDLTTEDPIGPGATVVGPLRPGIAPFGKARRVPFQGQHRVLLLDAEPRILIRELRRRLGGCRPVVRVARGAVGVVDLAQHEDVVTTPQRVGAREDRLEDAVRRVTFRLFGG